MCLCVACICKLARYFLNCHNSMYTWFNNCLFCIFNCENCTPAKIHKGDGTLISLKLLNFYIKLLMHLKPAFNVRLTGSLASWRKLRAFSIICPKYPWRYCSLTLDLETKQKHMKQRQKKNKWDYVKLKSSYIPKETVHKMKTAYRMDKIFANYISDKELISKIYKQFT